MTTQVNNGDILNNELNSTELGSFLVHNRNLIIGLVVVIILGVAGYGVTSYLNAKKEDGAMVELYTYESTILKSYVDGKIAGNDVAEALTPLLNQYKGMNAVFASTIFTVDALMQKKDFAQADSLLTMLSTNNDLQKYFVDLRRAVVSEELLDHKRAVSILKGMLANPSAMAKGRTELDLGRNLLLLGNKEEAKVHFENVLKENTQNFYKTLATEFLNNL